MHRRRSGSAIAQLLILLLPLCAAVADAAVSAQLDRSRAALGETVTLIIASDGEEDPANTDLAPLDGDFDILQRSSSNSMQIINGRTQRSRELRLELMPTRQGVLTIPALDVDGARTLPLELAVSAAPQVDAADQDVLFTAEVDRQSVYVQQQVILTLRVEQAINLDDRSISELELEQNAFVTPLGQNSYQRNRDGRRWLVNELRFAIFPQESGRLLIPAQTFVARERRPSRSLFDLSSGPRLQRRTEALEISVEPRPPTFPANADWLPAQELTVEEQWSGDPDALEVGQSLTRTVVVRAKGLQGAQLPPLLFSPPEGLKYYPDQPAIEDDESDLGVLGTRVDSAALVPVQAGRYTVPEVRIAWWDTGSDALRYATLPARTLDVAPPGSAQPPVTPQTSGERAGQPQPAAEPTPPATDTPSGTLHGWQLATAACAAGWLGTLLLWWSGRRRARTGKARRTSVAAAANSGAPGALRTACRAGDAASARNALQQYLRERPDFRPSDTLYSYAQRQASPTLLAAIETLERALYAQSAADWNGSDLLQAVEALAIPPRASLSDVALAPLYPTDPARA